METRSNQVLVGSVVLILLMMLALFFVWIARLNGGGDREYDVFFKQSVTGINKGSNVSYAGVPSGEVRDIALWKEDPEYVRVRIAVNEDVPVLEGTTATIQGVGFTGVSEVLLDGGVKGQKRLECPKVNPLADCPFGVPVIPTRRGGLGALLSSAPQLLERLSALAGRLNELLDDKNQASIQGILANTNRLTKSLADQAPQLGPTLAETRATLAKLGATADQIGTLAETTNGVMRDDLKPAAAKLSGTVAAAKRTLETLDATLTEARPGVRAFSTQTVPELGQLVRDLRIMSAALTSVAEKIDQGGAGALLSQPALPDYKPGRK